MTAYLQPGDKIHIAFPVTSHPGLMPIEANRLMAAELAAVKKDFTELYGKQGVEIAMVTGWSTITAPVVVAVFREPKDGTP